ncbi:MAG: DNA mismatch repair protein MutS [Chthonomonadales bacterium]|nr:DNA mismatch repair protein MutS [Chthonomonadales bacterium]
MRHPTERGNQPPDDTPRTPLMQQYFGARAEHPGVLLLMRVGDFYEAYGDDAVVIAEALNITLTGRDDGGQRTPMAGVPHHAAERYIARLIRQGHRVAIMDQVEDPKLARGLVKRRVTRVVSRGTVFEDALLDASANNYLVAAVVGDPVSGVGVVDVTTGEFLATELGGEQGEPELLDEICRLEPAEVLVPEAHEELAETIRQATGAPVTVLQSDGARGGRGAREVLLRHFQTASLRGFGCEEYTAGVEAAALVLRYLQETQVGALGHITSLSTYSTRQYMTLDAVARRNLEIASALGEGGRARSLLGVLDETLTPMGGRLLRRRLDEPLLNVPEINARLDAVEELHTGEILRGDVRETLHGINDVERLVSRASAGMANARDLVGLRESLGRLGRLREVLAACRSATLRSVAERLGAGAEGASRTASASVGSVEELLARALHDEPPAGVREGGLIRSGYSEELDALRAAAGEGRSWIASLEAGERERTGIPSLKVGYNAVFGYYIEVTRTHLARVPNDYIRKQTTAAGERYITPDLKDYEARVLGADEKAIELEHRLFCDVRDRVADAATHLLGVARAVAELDVCAGLAEVSVRNRYVRPSVDDSDAIAIRGGRHPVVERIQGAASFVPNDCALDCAQSRLHIITGPNMSGKSTALRQVALIVLLAQVGSFVPADEARIGVVDRIFTRVGAHDELATGQSTFLVEMNETASILNNATPRSLVILDEIGRGTSTYDGLSIAWAVAEHLASVGCKTLFATHYHHLNELARQTPGVCNFRVAVKEQGERIIWLHRLVPGGTDRSYGIQVARMAGVPPEVIERAREVLMGLERGARGPGGPAPGREAIATQRKRLQLTLFEAEKHPVLEELESLDVSDMTPVEALMRLDALQRKVRQG